MYNKIKYYFDTDLLLSLNLPIKKYSLQYILNKVIYNNKNNISCNNILNTIINKSKKNNELDFHLLNINIRDLIKNNIHEKIPNYLDKGYQIKSIII